MADARRVMVRLWRRSGVAIEFSTLTYSDDLDSLREEIVLDKYGWLVLPLANGGEFQILREEIIAVELTPD